MLESNFEVVGTTVSAKIKQYQRQKHHRCSQKRQWETKENQRNTSNTSIEESSENAFQAYSWHYREILE